MYVCILCICTYVGVRVGVPRAVLTVPLLIDPVSFCYFTVHKKLQTFLDVILAILAVKCSGYIRIITQLLCNETMILTSTYEI